MKYFKLIVIAMIFLVSIISIILGGLYVFKLKEKRTLTDNDRKNTTGAFIALKDGITHYQIAGPDTGQVVILLNGFSVPYYLWDGTFQYLVKHNYRTIRYDYYGRGYSDRPNAVYNKQIYFNQLKQLISNLKLKKPVDLVGLSFGGMLATDFAGNYPLLVRKIVLIDPVYDFSKPDKPEFMARYYEITHANERAESQLLDFKYPAKHPDWVNKYRAQMMYKGFAHSLLSTLYNYNYNGQQSNRLLNSKHKPVLLIWGRDDQTVPFNYSDSIRSYLNVKFFPIEDTGHLPPVEQTDKVNQRLVTFLNE